MFEYCYQRLWRRPPSGEARASLGSLDISEQHPSRSVVKSSYVSFQIFGKACLRASKLITIVFMLQ
jgi:hypothetical protein